MKLIVLAIVSIAVFRVSCRERPNGRDLNDDGLNPSYGSTLPDDRDFSDGDDLDYGSDLPGGYKDETSTIGPNTISSGSAELVSSTDLDMSFPPLEFGLGDLQDGFRNYDSSDIVNQQKEDETVRSERKSRVSSKCKPDGVCTLLGGTCISNTTHCSGRVVSSLCGGEKCRCCFTVNMEVKMNDLETEFRSMVVNITATNSNLNTKIESLMSTISNLTLANSKLDLKIDSIMSSNSNLTIANSNMDLKMDSIMSSNSNLTIANSNMKNELDFIIGNVTNANANQDLKLDSIIEHQGCPDGLFFFSKTNQCFRLLNDKARKWDEGKAACKALGLELAHPYDPIFLSDYLVARYGSIWWVWVDARGDNSNIKWQRKGIVIRSDNSLWWDNKPNGVTTGHCLWLMVGENWKKDRPTKAYYSYDCNRQEDVLCELVKE